MLNLGLTSQDMKQLAERIADHLHRHTSKIYDDGHRNHLGASQIGDDCWRKLWYSFRWVKTPTYKDKNGKDIKGRMLRLFNRGHKEEFRFVEWLRGMGFKVDEFDPASLLFYDDHNKLYFIGDKDTAYGYSRNVTGDHKHEERAAGQGVKRKQLRISDCYGHFGGSIDGQVDFPAEYGEFPRMLAEFKTSSTKYFDKLVDNGVKFAKPEHYAQMCSYGKRLGLRYGLYMCVNKDTDEVHIEIVELNEAVADQMTAKAGTIIFSQEPPQRVSENSAFWKCKMCTYADICHRNTPFEKNCRSCKHAAPGYEGKWICALFSQQHGAIPDHIIPVGCEHWRENK